MTESGISDIIETLRRFHFEIREIPYDITGNGQNGFVATRDGVTVAYDGKLTINHEPVQTPFGDFDADSEDQVNWFMAHVDLIASGIARQHIRDHGSTDMKSPNGKPEDSKSLASGEDKG